MKYAVVHSGGKQYRVSEGDVVIVDKLGLEANTSYTFPEVFLFVDERSVEVGTPTVKGVQVVGTVVAQKKTRKIRVAKFKAKAKYRRVHGHRSTMTHVKIDKISHSASSGQAK